MCVEEFAWGGGGGGGADIPSSLYTVLILFVVFVCIFFSRT